MLDRYVQNKLQYLTRSLIHVSFSLKVEIIDVLEHVITINSCCHTLPTSNYNMINY